MILAITGCPGSGKSVLSREIADHGWELLDVDDLGRTVVEDDPVVLADLAEAFGGDIILGDGTLDRRLLAGRAFVSRESTGMLNRIVHPRLVGRLESRLGEFRRDAVDAVIDCALVFEWDMGDRFDLVGFHGAVLGSGALPLPVLDQNIARWTAGPATAEERSWT